MGVILTTYEYWDDPPSRLMIEISGKIVFGMLLTTPPTPVFGVDYTLED